MNYGQWIRWYDADRLHYFNFLWSLLNLISTSCNHVKLLNISLNSLTITLGNKLFITIIKRLFCTAYLNVTHRSVRLKMRPFQWHFQKLCLTFLKNIRWPHHIIYMSKLEQYKIKDILLNLFQPVLWNYKRIRAKLWEILFKKI